MYCTSSGVWCVVCVIIAGWVTIVCVLERERERQPL